MKKQALALLALLAVLVAFHSASAFADDKDKKPAKESAKDSDVEITDVTVKPGNVKMTRVDLGFDNLFYYIDRVACICWVRHQQTAIYGIGLGISVVDCKKLAAYAEVKEAVKGCL